MMSRLHKKVTFSLVQKMEILFVFLFLYGWYKNGLYPYLQGFYPISHVFLMAMYPISAMAIGFLFERIFPHSSMFSYTFLGLLLGMGIPISTPIWLFLIFLTCLFFTLTILLKKNKISINLIVLSHLLLVAILFLFNRYFYFNLLEESNSFAYSLLDAVLGKNVGGLYSSNILILLISLVVLCFDYYYKKEIPLYSFGIYFISLIFYSFIIGDMQFFLNHFCLSPIFFALIFVAPLSIYSPYDAKIRVVYSFLIGILILPFSCFINFYEGVYLAILVGNIVAIILEFIKNKKKNT